jgi:hypothetical protein
MRALQEVVQFIPVLTLAAGFVIAGEIDLSVAAARFTVAAILALIIVGGLAWRQVRQNPFLVGADLWLIVGAVSFNLPIEPIKAAMVQAGGGGIFLGALAVGLLYTLARPEGYLGVESRHTRLLSAVLLVLTAAGAAWAMAHPDSIRLGAALPFIGVNVLRRVMGRLAAR